MQPGQTFMLWAVGGFLGLLVLEAIFSWRLQDHRYDRRDTWASLGSGLGFVLIGLGTKLGILWLLTELYAFAPYKLPYTWWSWVLCYIVVDFFFYWSHRLGHETRFGWAIHVPHHNSQFYNLSTALRQSWTTHLLFFVFLPIPLLGFDPMMAFVCNSVNSIYQYWIHTEYVGRLPRPIEWLLNTPSHHRVHHASNPEYLDRNYGGTFIIWDRLFGTFRREEHRPRYGITSNIESHNLLVVNFHEWAALFRDLFRARSLREVYLAVLAKPGRGGPNGCGGGKSLATCHP